MKICVGVGVSKRCPDVCIVPQEKFLRFDKADISVAKINPRRIQDFARACGRREYVGSQLFMPTLR